LFGGVYQDEGELLSTVRHDPENQRKVMTELVVPDDQWSNFLKDRQGAIAGKRTAERSTGKSEDRIPIRKYSLRRQFSGIQSRCIYTAKNPRR